MSTAPISPKTPSDPGRRAFDHLRNFLALVALWTFGAFGWHADQLAQAVPGWIWWPAVFTFLVVALGFSILFVLQTADLLLVPLRRLFPGKANRPGTFVAAMILFTPLCIVAVSIVLLAFYPELASQPPR